MDEEGMVHVWFSYWKYVAIGWTGSCVGAMDGCAVNFERVISEWWVLCQLMGK